MRSPCFLASLPFATAFPGPCKKAWRTLRVLSLGLGICASTPAPAAAQVTYFHQPPTIQQLRAALLPPGTESAVAPPAGPSPLLRGGSRTRGIVLQPAGAASGASPGADPGSRPVAAAASGAAPAAAGSRAAALPINFDLGSSRVDRNSLPYVERIATLMRSDPNLHLVVEGHTDDRGSFNHNMVLSWDRAIGVYRALVESYGVEPTRLQVLGKGPLEPLPGSEPRDGTNRRVQFRIGS
jgi:outer membrane protein OmpA-like peptidoglycan-associated protein